MTGRDATKARCLRQRAFFISGVAGADGGRDGDADEGARFFAPPCAFRKLSGVRRYSASDAEGTIARVLDAVERGEEVEIERDGVTFRVTLARKRPRRARDFRPRFSEADAAGAAVDAAEVGDWSWQIGPDGASFVPAPARRRTA